LMGKRFQLFGKVGGIERKDSDNLKQKLKNLSLQYIVLFHRVSPDVHCPYPAVLNNRLLVFTP
jgi:hypothetical protein